jgi:dipeptidyl aminopeptidase/acylaminoacyl peptidase
VAKRVSPLTYVRAGLPPVMTVHGDKDPTVPYEHGVKLHEALARAGVRNRLLTIPGGGHGQFKPEERTLIFATIREFLAANGLPVSNP